MSASAQYRRPESVLVLVATQDDEVLMLERVRPEGFLQSVTGSLEWGETAADAARRELAEETGIKAQADALEDLQMGARFRILPEWGAQFAPDVRENCEHWFRLRLPARVTVRCNPGEHQRYAWLPADEAAARAASWSNRAAIERFIVKREA
ncbi:MAG: dihydroneopterin triphosphate diphosphatase [Gammaproteobacteria bacterium]